MSDCQNYAFLKFQKKTLFFEWEYAVDFFDGVRTTARPRQKFLATNLYMVLLAQKKNRVVCALMWTIYQKLICHSDNQIP